jgi:hypothetical protein
MNKKILIFSLSLSIALTCCVEPQDKEFEVRLSRELEEVITSYMRENDIGRNNKIITTEWIVSPYDKTEVYISNMNTDLYKKNAHTPTYYCVIENGPIIFVYSNIEGLITRETASILEELDNTLEKEGIRLAPDRGYDYSAPTWKYTLCAGEPGSISKSIDPMEYSVIPCGYSLRQDTSRTDSLYVIKE